MKNLRARPLDIDKELDVTGEIKGSVKYTSEAHSSGMNPEEEKEEHLQNTLNKGSVIPIPVVNIVEDYGMDDVFMRDNMIVYDDDYKRNINDYDLDSEDEEWISLYNQNNGKSLEFDQFESIITYFDHFTIENKSIIEVDYAINKIQENDLRVYVPVIYPYWKIKHDKNGALTFHLKDPKSLNKKRKSKITKTSSVGRKKSSVGSNRPTDSVVTLKTPLEKMEKLRKDFTILSKIIEAIREREKIKLQIENVKKERLSKRLNSLRKTNTAKHNQLKNMMKEINDKMGNIEISKRNYEGSNGYQPILLNRTNVGFGRKRTGRGGRIVWDKTDRQILLDD